VSEDGDVVPEGRGHPCKKDGVLLETFNPLRSPKRYQDPIFSALEDTNSYITLYLLTYFFFGSAPQKLQKLQTPKRDDEHPRHFYMGVCPTPYPLPWGRGQKSKQLLARLV